MPLFCSVAQSLVFVARFKIYIYILFSLSQPTKAGTGSVLNAVGEVEMDAMMMDGDNLGSGK